MGHTPKDMQEFAHHVHPSLKDARDARRMAKMEGANVMQAFRKSSLAAFVMLLGICLLICTACLTPSTKDDTGVLLKKATITDCSTSDEKNSEVDTSAMLVEALSFVDENPFYLNIAKTLSAAYASPLPTTNYIEKCEWKYDENGRVKSATQYKSSNELSTVSLSYDSHGSVSKVIGYTTDEMPDENGQTQHDFEISIVNESLGGGKYGANKFTVVHAATTNNDTVVFTYDKDKNITEVKSEGKHTYEIDVDYITSQKVPKKILTSTDNNDFGEVLCPTYDGDNKLVMLETGSWNGTSESLDGLRYEIQYSGKKYSRIRVYSGQDEVKYYEFSYNDYDEISSIRVYKKGGSQLYNISFSWESK